MICPQVIFTLLLIRATTAQKPAMNEWKKCALLLMVVQGQCQSSQEIFHMQDDALLFYYDIYGGVTQNNKSNKIT